MTSAQIINEFFARKGGVQLAECQTMGGGKVNASQVIYITIKQANWLLNVADWEGITEGNGRKGQIVGKLPDGAQWTLHFPYKNSRQQAASLQILS